MTAGLWTYFYYLTPPLAPPYTQPCVFVKHLTGSHRAAHTDTIDTRRSSQSSSRRSSPLISAGLACALAAFTLLVPVACGSSGGSSGRSGPPNTLSDIRDRGSIRVITSYGPFSYFLYRGEPLGFEYQLSGRLGKWLDLEVDIVPATDIGEMFEMLESGEGDVIAYRLSVTADRRERVQFSDPVTTTRQVLVQPKPDDWRNRPRHVTEQSLIREPYELAGREVHVRADSAYIPRLENLSEEIGAEIEIIEAPSDVTTIELISQVNSGDIPLTVADENIARIASSYYQQVDVEMDVSLSQRTAWAVHPEADDLLASLNSWLAEEKQGSDFHVIYNRYFDSPQAFRSRLSDDAFGPLGDSISPWDDLFREAAGTLSWDWRLLAALAFQESRFDPRARSWAGAVGLMQLMPGTARAHGATVLTDPEQSIWAATQYIQWLENTWEREIPDAVQRRPFVLASYNAGMGHVRDARRLTEHFDGNPDSWDQVSKYLLRKSDPQYYEHEVVEHGYARGSEPVAYVRNISRLYEHYVRFTDKAPQEPPPDPARPPKAADKNDSDT